MQKKNIYWTEKILELESLWQQMELYTFQILAFLEETINKSIGYKGEVISELSSLLEKELQERQVQRNLWEDRYKDPNYWRQTAEFFPIERPIFEKNAPLKSNLSATIAKLQLWKQLNNCEQNILKLD